MLARRLARGLALRELARSVGDAGCRVRAQQQASGLGYEPTTRVLVELYVNCRVAKWHWPVPEIFGGCLNIPLRLFHTFHLADDWGRF